MRGRPSLWRIERLSIVRQLRTDKPPRSPRLRVNKLMIAAPGAIGNTAPMIVLASIRLPP
jgi:hypothetical protein